jgi:hypothetical protein
MLNGRRAGTERTLCDIAGSTRDHLRMVSSVSVLAVSPKLGSSPLPRKVEIPRL